MQKNAFDESGSSPPLTGKVETMRNVATVSVEHSAAAPEGRTNVRNSTDKGDEGLTLDHNLKMLIDELVIPVLLEPLTTETVEQVAA
jgi:hypothetical protein